jgi:hypothetical protein
MARQRHMVETDEFSERGNIIMNLVKMYPFMPNPCFTGREAELGELRRMMQRSQYAKSVAISGLGGVGKTQLAVQYAFTFLESEQHLFWVNAATIESLFASYRDIASRLGFLDIATKNNQAVISLVNSWLKYQTNWVLVVDGANTDDVLATVRDALPKDSARGHILLTTRSAYPSSIFGPPLTMRSFSDEQGALLLFREAGLIPEQAGMEQVSKYDCQMARRIVHELGGLPLAVVFSSQ